MTGGRHPFGDGLRAAARAMGVTRVARLTGLDRTAVEVASAVRPEGHVLQVTNGKGLRFEDAARGALLEAAELHAAERPTCEAFGSAAELAGRPGGVISPRDLEPAAGDASWDGIRLAWRTGVDLASGAPVLVPAHAVHVPPPGGASLGPALVRWTSNGMGAAPGAGAALLHALLEAVERDRLARALPEGFTEGEVARRMIEPRSLTRAAPGAAALTARLEARGFRVYLFDVTDEIGPTSRRTSTSTSTPTSTSGPAGRLALPCAAALVVDHAHGPVPVAAGYACRLRGDDALVAALMEAAQSRATEIHGAREDVALADRRQAVALAGLCARTSPRRSAAALPDVSARGARAGVAAVLARLRRAGFDRAVAVHLEGPPGVAVVKVLVPGLLLSELL